MSVTPSQTVGPFFKIGLIADEWRRSPVGSPTQIEIRGTVYDAEAKPVVDAMLEFWQPESQRFIRVETDPTLGTFAFQANEPRSLREPSGRSHAPHVNVGVFARGLLKRLHTRIYLPDEPLNASDPILDLVPAHRRATLVAKRMGDSLYGFDIRLSGSEETVFFAC